MVISMRYSDQNVKRGFGMLTVAAVVDSKRWQVLTELVMGA